MESYQKVSGEQYIAHCIKVLKTKRRTVCVKCRVCDRHLATVQLLQSHIETGISKHLWTGLITVWPPVISVVLQLVHGVGGFCYPKVICPHVCRPQRPGDPL